MNMVLPTDLTLSIAVSQLDAERGNYTGIVHIGVTIAVPGNVQRWVATHVRWHAGAQLIFVERSGGWGRAGSLE